MKHTLKLALLVVAIGLVFTGCDKMWTAPQGPDEIRSAFYLVCGDPDTFDIVAGQHYDAGDILVQNCTSYVLVKIVTEDGWTMSESHVAIANTCAELPRNPKGALVPGQFPYSATHDPAVTEYTYYIPIGDWEPGDTVAIAVHVVVANGYQQETGWGDTWKGCFRYVIKDCWKDVSLPTGFIRLRGWYPNGTYSYWRIELGNVPTGFDVWNGIWSGWCAEPNVYMNQNTWYDVRLWSTLDPTIPPRVQNDGWDNVNYLLNHKHPDATFNDVQAAIWYLLGRAAYPSDAEARWMADQATMYGDGYKPPVGGWIAVICETDERVQLVFIEVDP
jgi:hypothetical protein